MQGPFERVVHCSGQNSSLAPGTAVTGTRGPITCFLRKPIPVPPPAAKAQCTAHRQASASVCHQGSHSGARRQARHLLSRPPQQTCKLTAKLHRTSATTHPSCHTPLSPFCSVAAKPPTTTVTATTPLLSHPFLPGAYQPHHSFAITTIAPIVPPPPEYTTPSLIPFIIKNHIKIIHFITEGTPYITPPENDSPRW